MSDLTMIAEYIRNAMDAIDETHQASVDLREEANHDKLKAFRAKMAALEEHLEKLKMVLDNEEAYAMDELMDAMSLAYSNHRANYRRTPRMREEP